VKIAIIVSLAVCFLGALAAFVILVSTGKDVSAYIAFVGGMATSLVPNLFTLLKTHQTQADVTQIKEQTNGPLTELKTQVDEIAKTINTGGT